MKKLAFCKFIIAVLSFALSNSAFGFKPLGLHPIASPNVTDYSSGEVRVPQTHVAMTRDVLINGILLNGVRYSFSTSVVGVIEKANKDVDLAGLGFTISVPHCDGETLNACSERVQMLQTEIVEKLSADSPAFEEARELVGQALHTIQDFYAHSNYPLLFTTGVQSGIAPIETGFEPTDILGSDARDAEGNETCLWETVFFIDDRPTDEYGPRGLAKITTGYFSLVGVDPIKYKCKHGGEGTGINKDYPTNERFDIARFLSVNATEEFLTNVFEKVLEDGSISDASSRLKEFAGLPGAKLGFVIDVSGSMTEKVGGVQAAIAEAVAEIDEDPRKNVAEFLVVPYSDPTVGSVRRASNTEEMLEAINSLSPLDINSNRSCDEQSTRALSKAVDAASAGSILFLYTDAGTRDKDGSSWLVSRAVEKDITINIFVSNRCSLQDGFEIEYFRIASGTGGQVLRYSDTPDGARDTLPTINRYFYGDLEEFNRTADSVSPESEESESRSAKSGLAKKYLCNISANSLSEGAGRRAAGVGSNSVEAKATDQISGCEGRSDFVTEHLIQVDSSVTGFVAVVGGWPLGSSELIRPDGTEVTESDPDIFTVTTPFYETFSVNSPQQGDWVMRVSGSKGTEFELDVKMNTSIRIDSFYFGEEGGRREHTGLVPLPGQPLSTEAQQVYFKMSGEISSAELIFAGLDGEILDTIPLTELSNNGTYRAFIGEAAAPAQEFRAHVRGLDSNGAPYQRLYPQVFRGRLFSVRPILSERDLVRGKPFTAQFELKNTGGIPRTGAFGRFRVQAYNSQGYPVTLSGSGLRSSFADPSEGEKTDIGVTIEVPADAPVGEEISISLVVDILNEESSRNHAQSTFRIGDDSDADGVSDEEEQGGFGIDPEYDGNADGIADYLQATVVSMYSTLGDPYLTIELMDSGRFSYARATTDPSMGRDQVAGFGFPQGFLNLAIVGLAAGEATQVRVHYPLSYPSENFYTYGASADRPWSEEWRSLAALSSTERSALFSLQDGADEDSDALIDGLITIAGGFVAAVDPGEVDTDGDGIPDVIETENGLDPLNTGDAILDVDGDGLSNLVEFENGTDINDPDSDGDGLPDGFEVSNGLDPLDSSDAILDPDDDGLSNLDEFEAGTNPANPDSDGDGVDDGAEVAAGTDPANPSDGPGTPTNPEPIEVSVLSNWNVLVLILLLGFTGLMLRHRRRLSD